MNRIAWRARGAPPAPRRAVWLHPFPVYSPGAAWLPAWRVFMAPAPRLPALPWWGACGAPRLSPVCCMAPRCKVARRRRSWRGAHAGAYSPRCALPGALPGDLPVLHGMARTLPVTVVCTLSRLPSLMRAYGRHGSPVLPGGARLIPVRALSPVACDRGRGASRSPALSRPLMRGRKAATVPGMACASVMGVWLPVCKAARRGALM